MMKKLYILLLLILPLLSLASCSKDDDTAVPSVKPEASGTMTDTRDGYIYHWVRYGGLDWMVENSHYNTEDSNCGIYTVPETIGQDADVNKQAMLANYGYLYNYAGAKAAVPDGWRLPTDEDYQKLEQTLGMSAQDVLADGWRGSYQATLLIQGADGTGLKFLFAGLNDANSTSYASHYLWLTAYGYYWTATADASNASLAYYRKIQYNSGQIWRHTGDVKNMYSVRFVRNAQ